MRERGRETITQSTYFQVCVASFPGANGSASAERVGQGEVRWVTRRVTCTWWLLGLAVKAPWLGPGGTILAMAAWTGLGNATLTL